ncbi:Yersinia protein of uncharacterised function (DUF3831) [Yersinia enterocolitica]|nr:Yersinia protein of uncharacterised function (DUF3831) [Yersinia enterocolitica]
MGRRVMSAPGMARVEPPGMGLRRLYDLPVFTDTSTLSLTSGHLDGLQTAEKVK